MKVSLSEMKWRWQKVDSGDKVPHKYRYMRPRSLLGGCKQADPHLPHIEIYELGSFMCYKAPKITTNKTMPSVENIKEIL